MENYVLLDFFLEQEILPIFLKMERNVKRMKDLQGCRGLIG